MMELAERIGPQGQEVKDFIREQETAREERRLQREEVERQTTCELEIARLDNERPANLQNTRNNGKAPKLPSFTDGTDLHVMVDCCRSKLVNFVSGVLQGSVLGPLLFLLYTRSFFSFFKIS